MAEERTVRIDEYTTVTSLEESEREQIARLRRATIWGPGDAVYLPDEYYRQLIKAVQRKTKGRCFPTRLSD